MERVHIKNIASGDVLRIAMRNGRTLERSVTTREGVLPKLLTKRHRRAGNVSRCVINSRVLVNDPLQGVLTLSVQEKNLCFQATVLYKDILNAHKWITPSVGIGIKALPRLLRVYF